MSLHPTQLPAVPRLSVTGRQDGEGATRLALPNPFRHWRAILLGNPAAIQLHQAAQLRTQCARAIEAAINRARPADGGASTSLAQPVPYHALHGETGEGFETRRSRYDLPAGVTVILALGFLTPILAIVIIRHAS